MNKKESKNPQPWFDPEELRRTLALSPEERLRLLEELNRFLDAFTPEQNKRIWEEMKKRGW